MWWNMLKIICLSFPGRKEGNRKGPFINFMSPMTQKPKELACFLTTLNGVTEKHMTFSAGLCKQDMYCSGWGKISQLEAFVKNMAPAGSE